LKKIKSNLTIQEIGKFRFYSGLFIGFGTSFFLYIMFQYFILISYELATLFSGINNTKPIEDLTFENAFFLALLASSLGFSFTTYVWMSNVFHNDFRIRRLTRIAQTNSMFIIGLMAYMLFRFFTVLMTFNVTQIDFDLIEHFGIIIFTLPIFIFLYNWIFILKAYKSKIPLIISLGILILYGLILSGIRT